MSEQQIVTPFGITVFGSAVIEVQPDIALITFNVSKIAAHPREAYAGIREAAKAMQSYLSSINVDDNGSSQIHLHEHKESRDNKLVLVGYRTQVGYRVVLNELSRLEEVLAGIVDIGVTDLSVTFQATQLKELRDSARRKAIANARAKADLYCQAAEAQLGEIIHIEDLNPDYVQRFRGSFGAGGGRFEEDDPARAFEPGKIGVTAAVFAVYKLKGQQPF